MSKDLEKNLGTKNYLFFMGVVDLYFRELTENRDKAVENTLNGSLGKNIDNFVASFLKKELKDEMNYGKIFSKFSSIDPIYLAEELVMENAKNNGEEITRENVKSKSMGLGLFLMQVKSRIVNEVTSQLNDTQFSDTIENQIRVAESLGFEKIFEKNSLFKEENVREDDIEYYRKKIPDEERLESVKGDSFNISYNEYFYVFYNKEDGVLLTMDTYNNRDRNSSDIYFGGFLKEGKENVETFYSLGMSRSAQYAPEGNLFRCSLDVREGFAVKYIQLKSCFNFEKKQNDFSYYNFYSHVFKNEGIKVNKEFVMKNILSHFPQEIKENLLDFHISKIKENESLNEFDLSDSKLEELLGKKPKGVIFKNFLKENAEKYKEELLSFYAREAFSIQPKSEKESEYAFSALNNFKDEFINNTGFSNKDYNLLSASVFANRRDIFDILGVNFDNVVNKMVEEYKSLPNSNKIEVLGRNSFINDMRFNRMAKESISKINEEVNLPSIEEIVENPSIFDEIKEVNKLKNSNKLN